GVIVGADNQPNVTISWGNGGFGSLRVTEISALGCDSTVYLPVEINVNPVAHIEGSSVACANSIGNPYYLQDYGVNAGINLNYQWSTLGGSIVNGQNSDSVTVNWGSSGTYPLILRVTNPITGCLS